MKFVGKKVQLEKLHLDNVVPERLVCCLSCADSKLKVFRFMCLS